MPILSGVVLRGQVGGLRGFSLSSAYVLSMAACFAVLGALMGVFGAELNLQARLQSPWVLVPFALFFGVFALAMFGLYELRLPHFISDRLDRVAGNTAAARYGARRCWVCCPACWSRPAYRHPWPAPCCISSSSGDALGGGLKLFILGLGMGTPMLLFTTGGSACCPSPGPGWSACLQRLWRAAAGGVSIWLLERAPAGGADPGTLGPAGRRRGAVPGRPGFTPKTHRQKLSRLVGLLLLVYALCSWTGALQGHSDPLRPLDGPVAATSNQRRY